MKSMSVLTISGVNINWNIPEEEYRHTTKKVSSISFHPASFVESSDLKKGCNPNKETISTTFSLSEV